MVPYVGTNLNIDLILQSAFWLLLFSFIPKHEKNYIEFKNTSVIISIVLLIIHFFSENEFYSYNSKIFSTSLENNYLLYSIVLTFFIYLKLFSQMLESRIKNILYFLPFLFLITGTYNSANLNIVFISLMFIGIITLFKNLKSKLLLVPYLVLIFLWISNVTTTESFFDVDKLRGFSSSSYNLNSILFWSFSYFFMTIGFIYIFKISKNELDLFKLRFNFLLSGVLIVFMSIISALNPVTNFFTYYYLGLNKTASKSFESVAGNAWRGISPSAESVGEFFAFVILFTLIVSMYKNNFNFSKYEIIFLFINSYGLYKSNNFAAFISLIIFLCLITIIKSVKNKKFKYSSIVFLIVFFPIIYFLFFNTFTVEESSRKLLKEGFAISNIDYLERNQLGESPIDENRFYEVILNENSDENISTSLVYLVNKYHFSERNNLPNLTTLISSTASPINRSEKWGIFFGKYNPNFKTLIFGTGPNNIVNYYFGHETKANYGLILPHSSLFSYLIFFGIFGLLFLLLFISYYLIIHRHNSYYLVLVFYFLINLMKSDSLLYLNSFLLFLFILNTYHIFKSYEKNE